MANPHDSQRQVPSPSDASASELEREIAEHRHAARYDHATTLAIEGYGPELLGFLEALHSADDAQEVFARACERLWRSAGSFRDECTFRTWMYAIAVNESRRLMASSERRRVRARLSEVSDPAAAPRTTTPAFLQSDTKQRFRALRALLREDEQRLLVLRIDRGFSWQEVARALAADPADPVSSRALAGYRKQFERVKEKLRSAAAAQGLLEDS